MRTVVPADKRRSWEEDGWCVLEGAVEDAELASAQRALAKLFPSASEMASGGPGAERWRTWDASWPEFPFRSRTLNRLVVSDFMIGLAQELLGDDDVRMYLAIATAKYAGQPSEYNQLLHTDYPNHTLTVPRPEAGYHQVETFIYLSDVGPHNGATRFVSRRRTAHVSVGEHTLNYADHGHLYEEPGEASAPAGSVVVYRPDVYHRSVDFTDPAQARFMLHASYRPAAVEWGGYQSWPFKGFSMEWHAFVQQATPRQLAVLGFPAPGHPFWTEQTLAGVASRYPALDLTPWRDAMSAPGRPAAT
ncbi:MAG TPA: phytanoyl-CoA dioxygenase family protein [Acidimicrobiales bacterium]|nr:phytanoyl-CoA dioxygenase family protein [Acidimicrobiales bacterium]